MAKSDVVRKTVIFLFVVLIFIVFWWSRKETSAPVQYQDQSNVPQVDVFSNNVTKYETIQKLCFRDFRPNRLDDLSFIISTLKESKDFVCVRQYKNFMSIFRLRVKATHINLSSSVKKVLIRLFKMTKKFEMPTKQTLFFIDNLYTLDSVVFNLPRLRFPDVWGNVTESVRLLVEESRPGCDFCAAPTNTAADTFGRIDNDHAWIVSNAFKIAKFHGLAIPREHNPTKVSQMQFIGTIDLIRQYFDIVLKKSPRDVYQLVHWELLLRAGCSQIHPHMHVITYNEAYYAKWNLLHRASLRFAVENSGQNYWTRLVEVYTTLGLTVRFGEATLLTTLTPIQDYEILIIARQPCLDFFRLAYFALHTFINDMNEPSVSLGWQYPKRHSNPESGQELPMLFRLVGRGDASSLTDNIGASDLFGTSRIDKDPYHLIEILRKTVRRLGEEKFEYSEWGYQY